MRPPPISRSWAFCSLVPFLLLPSPVLAQIGTLLGIPSLNAFVVQSTSSPQIFSLPPSGPPITVSVALCIDTLPLPRLFVSAISGPGQIGPNDPSSSEIQFTNGVGFWTGEVQSGATVAAFVGNGVATSVTTQWGFEIGVQEGNLPAHEFSLTPPILADTSSTQAIVFSPSFQTVSAGPSPMWPNYTLPSLRPSFTPPQFVPPSSILIFATPTNISSLPFFASSCALRQIPSIVETQDVFNVFMSTVVRDQHFGWQTEFVVSQGLQPSTNYTVWVTQGPKISGPLYIWTKSASFSESCAFVHALPYCPLIAYPIPIPPADLPILSPEPGKLANLGYTPILDESTIPDSISSNILGTLTNFSKILSTFPCGRDVYSPLHQCSDCFDSYRTWACFVSFPRCGGPLPVLSVSSDDDGDGPQVPLDSLKTRPASSAPRAAGFPVTSSAYDELLPCIESCNAVRRACPPFMGWKCPVPSINAQESYALGVWDSWDGTQEGGGLLGMNGAMGNGTVSVSDTFGRVWCNGA